MKKSIPDRQHTGEFREAAVSQVLVGERSIRQVARSLEMSSSTLGRKCSTYFCYSNSGKLRGTR